MVLHIYWTALLLLLCGLSTSLPTLAQTVSHKLPLHQIALTPEKHRLAVYVLFISSPQMQCYNLISLRKSLSFPEEHQMQLLTTLMEMKICEARNLKNFHLVLAKFAVLRVHPNGGEPVLLLCGWTCLIMKSLQEIGRWSEVCQSRSNGNLSQR